MAISAQCHALLYGIPARRHVAPLGGLKPATRKVFGAGNVRVLGGQGLLPIGACVVQARVGYWCEIVGAGQVKRHGLSLGHQGQVQWLTADGEHMAAKAQCVAAIGHQFLLVAYGAQGKVSGGLEAGVDVVRLNLCAQAAHVGHQGAQFGHQHVSRKIAVHILHAGQLPHAPLRALEDAPRGIDQTLHTLLARLGQALLARSQRFVHGFALERDVVQELLLIRKATFQLLQLRQQAGEGVVTFFWRVGKIEGVLDSLTKQLELGAELGGRFLRSQRLLAVAGIGAQAVDVGVQRRDAVQNSSAHHGVPARQPAQLLGQQIQPCGGVVQRIQRGLQARRRGGLGQVGRQRRQGLLVAGKGLVVGQELHGTLTHALLLCDQFVAQGADAREVGVTQLLERLQMAAAFTHTGQGLNEILRFAPQRAGDINQQCLLLCLCVVQGPCGIAAYLVDFLELCQRVLSGFGDGLQVVLQHTHLRVCKPEVGVAGPTALA